MTPWLRLATALEALTGFALITSAMTWFMLIYPPLTRRRSLGLRLATLQDAKLPQMMATLDACYEDTPRRSLARQLPVALALRDAATASDAPELRMSGEVLAVVLDHLASALLTTVPSDGGTEAVFTAYAAAHERRRWWRAAT